MKLVKAVSKKSSGYPKIIFAQKLETQLDVVLEAEKAAAQHERFFASVCIQIQ